MSHSEEVIVLKSRILDDFVTLKQVVSNYWNFLEQLPLDFFKNKDELIHCLEKQYSSVAQLNVQLQTLDLVEALIRFVIPHIEAEELCFQVPIRETDFTNPENLLSVFSTDMKELEVSVSKLMSQMAQIPRSFPGETEHRLSGVIQAITSLLKAIIRQDGSDIQSQIAQLHLLTIVHGSSMFREIGEITREVYDSLQELSKDVAPSGGDDGEGKSAIRNATDEMPDAVQKLYMVIEKLEEAANSNLEAIEGLLQKTDESIEKIEVLNQGIEELESGLSAMKDKFPDAGSEIAALEAVIQEKIKQQAAEVHATLLSNTDTYITVMTNQSFQDLTGQTLKKIIDFLEHLESKLVQVMQRFGNEPPGSDAQKELYSSPLQGRQDEGSEGEEISLKGPEESEEQRSSQSDVDSLLADMGF